MLFRKKLRNSHSSRQSSISEKTRSVELLDARNMLSASQVLAGDADCNGTVEFADFLTLSENFGLSKTAWTQGDFDGSGTIGFLDFLILSENFGQSSPANFALPLATLRVDEAVQIPVENNGRFNWSSIEMEVVAPQLLDYRVSLRAASLNGTQIKVQMIGEAGEESLATIDVASTASWTELTDSGEVTISIAAGTRTLRFTNLVNDANIDSINFSAGANDHVVTVSPEANDGSDINPLKGFNSGWWRDEDHASVGFQYIEWGVLEPEDDVFDWAAVEEVLDRPTKE